MIDRRTFLISSALGLSPARVPAKGVVLTFDDAVKSHRTFVAPLLKEVGFRATFFVTHGWMPDTEFFMSWREIAEIHEMGFEIGNHSWTHADFSQPRNAARLAGELALVENELKRVGVPRPVSFAYSGNSFGPEAIKVLTECGYTFARRGEMPEVEYGKAIVGPLYDPAHHHRLLIPTTGDAYPNWTFEHFQRVMSSGGEGRVIVLQFHGVPDVKHPWVNTEPDAFRKYVAFLKEQNFETLAVRDLERFVDLKSEPADPLLNERSPIHKSLLLPVEMQSTRANMEYWLADMARHQYTSAETAAVTGMPAVQLPAQAPNHRVLPYPGGRPLRIGFRDGAIDPLRGTKATVFLPWDPASYVVIDLPEAIFSNLGLLFLAHTHVPTIWNEKNAIIENQDWERHPDGDLTSHWRLPNGVSFGASIKPAEDEIHMELWLRNGANEPLNRLRTQICVLLKEARSFNAQTNENKTFGKSISAVQSAEGRRYIRTEWERCGRTWGNAACPCMHSDPVLPDCEPGQTVSVRGRLWF